MRAYVLSALIMLVPGEVLAEQPRGNPAACVAKTDAKERLACFDDAFRQPASAPMPGAHATIADIMADFEDLRGKHVDVTGFMLLMGDTAILYPRAGDMTGVFVELKRLPRDHRHAVFEKCGSGCDITVSGKVERIMMSPGLSADAVSLK